MKKMLCLGLCLVSFNLFAETEVIDLQGLYQLVKEERANLSDALIKTHGKRFGNCNLDWFKNDEVSIYADVNRTSPVFIAHSNKEWVKFSTNAEFTQIKATVYGKIIEASADSLTVSNDGETCH